MKLTLIYKQEIIKGKWFIHEHATHVAVGDIYGFQKRLEDMGELENTLIFFTSDNEPHNVGHDPGFFNSNGSLKGIKRDLYKGGIRVPAIAYWKGTIEAGSVIQFYWFRSRFYAHDCRCCGNFNITNTKRERT